MNLQNRQKQTQREDNDRERVVKKKSFFCTGA